MFCTSPNITNWTYCCSGGTTGPNFAGKGWCVTNSNDIDITTLTTSIPFDSVFPQLGQFNDTNLFTLGTPFGNIPENGYYYVGANILYNHDFNSTSYNITCSILKNASLIPNPVARTILNYNNNDELTVVCCNIVKLSAGDNLSVSLFAPLFANQSIKLSSTFCCQRIT
jgi:hypothetical protein